MVNGRIPHRPSVGVKLLECGRSAPSPVLAERGEDEEARMLRVCRLKRAGAAPVNIKDL